MAVPVRKTVYQLPLINMGTGKSFCNGDRAVFNAGNGFQNYWWKTSAITQQITAEAMGVYAVTSIIQRM